MDMITPKEIASVASAFVAVGAWVVAFAFIPYIREQWRLRPPLSNRFWFALGIALAWAGGGAQRDYFLIRKVLRGYDVVTTPGLDSWVYAATFLPIVGAIIILIRTVSRSKHGEKMWVMVTALLLVLGVVLASGLPYIFRSPGAL